MSVLSGVLFDPLHGSLPADMMNASFDDLRAEVAPAARSVAAGSALTFGGGGGLGGVQALMGGSAEPRTLYVSDHPQELDVYFHGAGATPSDGVSVVDASGAAAACKGKNDFILFEPLDEALREGHRLVFVAPRGAPRSELPRAQAYLATSLARWLSEPKTDGAGRPYGEVKDEDPTLRKHFTRAQIRAIRTFGSSTASDASMTRMIR